MKKILAIVVVLIMCLSVVACSSDSAVVESYVNDNRDTLVESFTSSFTASGYACDAEVSVDGCTIIIDAKSSLFDNYTDEMKAQLQQTYDGMDSMFDSMYDMLVQELPECDGITINVCSSDGEVVATIKCE